VQDITDGEGGEEERRQHPQLAKGREAERKSSKPKNHREILENEV